MKQKTLPILIGVLAATAFAAACQRTEQAPVTATEPTPAPASEPMPSTPAPAAPVDSGMSFADMDKNKDGGITRSELADTEMLSQHFAAADKDGDGRLSQSEVDGHRAEMAAQPGG